MINDRSLWALDVLASKGYQFDSSMAPMRIVGNPLSAGAPLAPDKRGGIAGFRPPLFGGWAIPSRSAADGDANEPPENGNSRRRLVPVLCQCCGCIRGRSIRSPEDQVARRKDVCALLQLDGFPRAWSDPP
jgi:hypothetical protein